MPDFVFETTVERGNREVDVEVTYRVTPGKRSARAGAYPSPAKPVVVELLKAVALDADEVTDYEWDRLLDEVIDHSMEAYREYLQEQGEDRDDFIRGVRSTWGMA